MFRVLIIDDAIYGAASQSNVHEDADWGGLDIGFVASFYDDPHAVTAVEVFVAKNAQLSDLWRLYPTIAYQSGAHSLEEARKFLQDSTVVVLDIGGLGTLWKGVWNDQAGPDVVRKNFQLIKRPAPADVSVDQLLDYPGVAFYHAHLQDFCRTQAVVIMTTHEGDSAKPFVEATLNPFCGEFGEPIAGVPWTTKFGRQEANERLKSLIVDLYQDYALGYVELTNRAAIELAGCHDMPVLIVGESGTGKEYIANAIHRRWASNYGSTIDASHPFEVVNCASLSAELAKSELFGHVAGSFTGALNHHFGLILRCCGFDSSQKGSTQSKKDDIVSAINRFVQNCREFKKHSGEKQLDYVRSHILVDLQELDVENIEQFMRSLQPQAESKPASRTPTVDSYKQALLDGLQCLGRDVVEDGYSLTAKMERPWGTLFFDEFGDLPPAVQTQLLRFGEERSGEIQPVGYPGRIAGLKVRMIFATSDPKVAAFAGERITNDGRKTESIRLDLLWRAKGQTIRVVPVTGKNAKDVLDMLIAGDNKTHPSQTITWSSGAKEFVVEQVEAMTDDKKPRDAKRVRVFGQRRELARLVQLVHVYVRTAADRGVKHPGITATEEPKGLQLSREVVEKLWRPSEVSLEPPGTRRSEERDRSADRPADKKGQIKALSARSKEIREQFQALVDECFNAADPSAGIEPLAAEWGYREVREFASHLELNALTKIREWMKPYANAKSSAERDAFCAAFSVGANNVCNVDTLATLLTDSKLKTQKRRRKRPK